MHQNRKNRTASRSNLLCCSRQRLHALKTAYVFQVGYHQGCRLTGALPDSHDCPQCYAHGDLGIAGFFRMVGTMLQEVFLFGNANFPICPAMERPKDLFAAPRPAHMRYSDPALEKIVEHEFARACHEWDGDGVLPMVLFCHAGGTQSCGDALAIILAVSKRPIQRITLSAPAMSF